MNKPATDARFGIAERSFGMILEAIEARPEIGRVVIFGSRAVGTEATATELSRELNERLPIPYYIDVVVHDDELDEAVAQHIRAEGRGRPDSDIDLAVAAHSREPLDPERLIDISLASSKATGREVQVRDLSRAQGLYLREVLTKGKTLLATDATVRGELIIRMLDFTEDMLPNIRRIQNANTERFIAGA